MHLWYVQTVYRQSSLKIRYCVSDAFSDAHSENPGFPLDEQELFWRARDSILSADYYPVPE
jgi:hypothetical protein